MNVKIAQPGKTWAYKDEQGNEIILGSTLYLGISDDGSRYYEIETKEEEHDRQN